MYSYLVVATSGCLVNGSSSTQPTETGESREIPPPSCKTIMYLEFLGSPRGSGFIIGGGGGVVTLRW